MFNRKMPIPIAVATRWLAASCPHSDHCGVGDCPRTRDDHTRHVHSSQFVVIKMVSSSRAPPAHDDLDELLQAFEPLPADVLASETPNETSRDTRVSQELIANHLQSSGPDEASRRPASQRVDKRARYRARSRNELLYLREIVAELELELGRWKAQVHGGQRIGVKPSAQAKVWKALAARQRLSRQDSEVENARLRVLLDNQIRFASQFQHLVRQREGNFGTSRTPKMTCVKIDAADAEVFENYLVEIEPLYIQTDDVLRETGVGFRPEVAQRFIRTQNQQSAASLMDGDAASCVEFHETNVLNIGLDMCRTSTWRLVMQHYLQHSGSVYKPRIENPDVLTIKFRYSTTWLGRDSTITITLSVKTYDEPNRQVNVYRALSVGDGALAGMATDETGWSVLTPSATSSKQTVSRSVTRMTAMRFHSLKTHKPDETPPQLLEFAKILVDFSDEDAAKMLPQLQQCPFQS